MRVAEVAYGNGDNSRKAFVLPVDGGAAGRTEMESKRITAFGGSHPRHRVAVDGDLLAAEPRLVADDGARAALALQAMAHGDARWFALNREVKLPATAGGASGRHGVGSVTTLDQAKGSHLRLPPTRKERGRLRTKVPHSAVSKEVVQCLFLPHLG